MIRDVRPQWLAVLLLAGCGAGTASLVAGGGGGGGSSNAPSVLSGFTVERPEVSPARVHFVLSDREGDPAHVALLFSVGNDPPQLLSQVPALPSNPAQLASSEAGVVYDLPWNFTLEPGLSPTGSFVDGVRVRAVLENGAQELVLGANGDFGLGNDPPEIAIEPLSGEFDGVVPIRFQVKDSSDDLVSIRAEFHIDGEPDDEWHVARPAGLAQGTPTPDDAFVGQAAPRDGIELVFFWDTDADLAELERDVRVRFTARDPIVPGETVASNAFRIDNNAEPIAVLHGDLLLTYTDERRGIPIPFTVTDEEGDGVEVAFQWTRPGEAFPELPATPQGIRAVLADPEQRRALRVCTEFPRAVTGRARPIDATTVELPELASVAPSLVKRGLPGRDIEIVRPPARLEAVTRRWPSNSLRTAAAALPMNDRLDVIVLDTVDENTWRLVQVELSTGALLREIARGAGQPSLMVWERDQASVLVASSIASAWRIDRVHVASGAVTALIDERLVSEPGFVRGIASLGTSAALVTVNDALLRADWSDPVNPRVAVVIDGLATPWGVIADPDREGRVYVSEYDAPTQGGGVGRVLSIDLDSRALEPVVAFDADGVSAGLPRPRELALVRDGSRLLAVCDTPAGGSQLRGVDLGQTQYSQAVSHWLNEALVLMDGLPAGSRSLTTGADDLVLFAGPRNDSLFAAGGVEQRRTIATYDAARRRIQVTTPFAPALAPGAVWRISDSLGVVPTNHAERHTFVWDSSDASSGQAVFRVTPFDAEVGTRAQTLAPKSIIGPLEAAPTSLGEGLFVHSAVMSDIDSDGDLDVLLTTNGAKTGVEIHYALQIGGEFGAPVQIGLMQSMPNSPEIVKPADLDGDGDIDVVALQGGPPYLAVYWQTGFLQFEAAPIVYNGAQSCTAVNVADMDRDGDLDILVADIGGGDRVRIIRQTSPGVFSPVSAIVGGSPTIVSTSALQAADMDGDGDLDVLTANGGLNSLTIFWQAQSGSFTGPPTNVAQVPAIQDPLYVHAADLDRDGDLDVFTSNSHLDVVQVFWQTGHHAFSAEPTSVGGPLLLHAPMRTQAADFDHDGNLDLIVEQTGSPQKVVAFRQVGRGVFEPTPVLMTDQVRALFGAADLNGDGDLDLLAWKGSGEFDFVSAFLQQGPWQVDPTGVQVSDTPPRSQKAIVQSADLDADGLLDLISIPGSGPVVTVNWQENARAFSSTPTILGDTGEVVQPGRPAVADLDGDGDLDIIAVSAVFDPPRGRLKIHWQLGAREFDSSGTELGGDVEGFYPTCVEAADLDGDGDLDLVSVGLMPGYAVFWQQSRAQFDSVPTIIPAEPPFFNQSGVQVADLDADGKLDLVSAGNHGLTVQWQIGAGVFDLNPTVIGPYGLPVVADFDGDGDLDLAFRGGGPNQVLVFAQVAPRQFEQLGSAIGIPFGGVANSTVTATDVDRDGDLDLIGGGIGQVYVIRQRGAGHFDLYSILGSFSQFGSGPRSAHAADLDGDGDADIIADKPDGSAVSIYWSGR